MNIGNQVGSTLHIRQVTLTAGSAFSGVGLFDAKGDLVECNYLLIATNANPNTTTGFISIIPDGISPYATSTLGNTASGMFGITGSSKHHLELFLGHGRTCTTCTLVNNTVNALTFYLNYGIVHTVNQRKALNYNPGI